MYLKHEQRAVHTGVLHNKRGWQHYIGNYGKCHGWCFANYISFTLGPPQLLADGTKEVKLRKSIYSQVKNLSFVLKKKLLFQKEKMNPTMLNLKISKYSCILSKRQGSKIISPLSLHFMLYHFTVVNEMVILNTTVEI